jgi:hypothetical protein
MDLLDVYQDIRKKIYDYFGYSDQWDEDIAIRDLRDYFWKIDISLLYTSDFSCDIENRNPDRVTQDTIVRSKYGDREPLVYRGDEYTLVICSYGAFWSSRQLRQGIILSHKRECE